MVSMEKRIKYFSTIIALFPLLASYSSPVPGVDLATLFIILFAVITLKPFLYKGDFMLIYCYVLMVTPIMYFMTMDSFDETLIVFLRYLKFLLVLGCVFGFGYYRYYYDEKIVFNVMQKCVCVNAALVLLQQGLYHVHYVFYNPLINFAVNDAYIYGYDMGARGNFFRPSGFFLEPSHLSLYMMVYMLYILIQKNDFKRSLVAAVAILATGSGMGLVFCFSIYCAYILINFRKQVIKTSVILISVIAAFIYMRNMTFFVKVVNRFATKNTLGGGNAILGRIGPGYQFFFKMNKWQKIFGTGYGNIPGGGYLNGVTYILNTLGIMGTVIFAIVFFQYFRKGYKWQKIGILMTMGLIFVSQMFTPSSLVFLFCIYQKSESLYSVEKNNCGNI